MTDQTILSLKATSVLSVLLWTKTAVTNLGLGGAKNNAGARAKEDTYQKNEDEVTDKERSTLDRAQRIVNNDLENSTYTMTLAAYSATCIHLGSNTDKHALAHIIMYTSFVLSRFGHSYTYIEGLSSARSLVWLVGFICTFGIAINGAIASFNIEL